MRERLGKWQSCCIRLSLVGGRVGIRLCRSGYSAVVGLGENVGGENICVSFYEKYDPNNRDVYSKPFPDLRGPNKQFKQFVLNNCIPYLHFKLCRHCKGPDSINIRLLEFKVFVMAENSSLRYPTLNTSRSFIYSKYL